MAEQKNLRVILYKDKNDIWHAQCLEHDIAVQDTDYNRLRNRFEATFIADANISKELNGAEFSGIDPAPEVFHEMWADIIKDFSSDPIHIGNNGVELELRIAA